MLFRLWKYKKSKRKLIKLYNDEYNYNYCTICNIIKSYTDNLEFILSKFKTELNRYYFYNDYTFDTCNLYIIEYNKRLEECKEKIKKIKKDNDIFKLLYKRNLLKYCSYENLDYIDSAIDRFENYYMKQDFNYEIKKCKIQMKIDSMEQDFGC